MNQRIFIFFLSVLMLSLVGCGGVKKPAGMPALHPTTLTLTQEGTPLAGATVTLVSQNKAVSQWQSGGATDAKGVIRIKTSGFDGAPEGTFKVVVTKTETEGTATVTQSSDEAGAKPSVSGGGQKSYEVVEKEYRSAVTTKLTLEVKAGKNAETFDVGKAVREQIINRTD